MDTGEVAQLPKITKITNDEMQDEFSRMDPRGEEGEGVEFSPSGTFLAWTRSAFALVARMKEKSQDGSIKKPLILKCNSRVLSLAFLEPRKTGPTVTGHVSVLSNPDFSRVSDTLLFTGQQDGRIRIWSATTGRLFVQLCDHTSGTVSLTLEPVRHSFLLSGSLDNSLKVWDLRDGGNMTRTLKEQKSKSGFCCSWNPKGEVVAVGDSAGTVCLWSEKEWKIIQKLEGHRNKVASVGWSRDGVLLASASHDTTVILWNPIIGKKLQILHHLIPIPRPIFAAGYNSHFVRIAAFSWDGLTLGTVSENGSKNTSLSFLRIHGKVSSLFHLSRLAINQFTRNGADLGSLPIPRHFHPLLHYSDLEMLPK